MQIKGDSSSRHNHGAVTESLLEEVITGTIGRIQQQKKNSAARRDTLFPVTGWSDTVEPLGVT